MRRWCAWILALTCVCLVGQTSQGRQSPPSDPAFDAEGFQAGRDYFSPLPFENIDTITGNVYLRFPTLVLPGNAGRDVRFEWSYNSKSQGWSWGIAGIPMSMEVLEPKPRHECGPVDPDTPYWYMPTLIGADGSRHETLWPGASDTGDELLTREFWSYHRPSRTVRLGNGVSVSYDHEHGFGNCGMEGAQITHVNDSYGNQLAFDYVDGMRMYQDLGNNQTREINFFHNADGTLEHIHHNGRDWRFEYNYDLPRLGRLAKIIPPEGPAWQFTYNGDDLATVTTPNGGTVTYGFGIHNFWRDMIGRPRRLVSSRVLASRTTGGYGIAPGTWTFDFDSDDDNKLTMTGPVNTIVYIAGITAHGWPVPDVRRIYQGAELLQEEVLDYDEAIVNVRPGAEYKVPVITSHSVKRYDGGSAFSWSTAYGYAGAQGSDFGRADYGAPNKITEDGDIDRVTDITYQHLTGPYVLRRPHEVKVNGEQFKSVYGYNANTGFRESATVHGVTTYFEHDGRGNIDWIDDTHADHPETTFSYSWGVQANVYTPEYTITRDIHERGTVKWEKRNNQDTTNLHFDALGRPTLVVPPEGHPTGTTYAADGRSITVQRTSASWTTSTLDGFGRVTETEDSEGVKTRTTYDAVGRTHQQSLPYVGATIPLTTFTYDGLNRVIGESHPSGLSRVFTYEHGVDVKITENNGGQLRITRQDWAPFGDPDDAVMVGLTDAEDGIWEYTYNAIGKLTSVSQPGTAPQAPRSVRTWEYWPGTAMLKKETHPEHGDTSYVHANGRLEQRTTPAGTFNYFYDDNDRVDRIDAPIAEHSVTIDYDKFDNRTLLQNASVNSVFGFDGVSRLRTRTDTVDGVTKTTTYDYDNFDDVREITYPSGQKIRYTYDSQHRAETITRLQGTSEVPLVTEIGYHPSGAVDELRMANGIRERFDFNPNTYFLERVRGAGSPLDISYTHDQVGNVRSVTDHKDSTFTYPVLGYDKLDRLTTAQPGFNPATFVYDPLGNRTSDGTSTYTINPHTLRLDSMSGPSQLPEVGEHRYDSSGNLQSIGPPGVNRFLFTYTPLNMVKRVEVQGGPTTEYRYDGDNLRTLRIMAGGASKDYFFNGMNGALFSEFHREGTQEPLWVRDYVYLGGRIVATVGAPSQPSVAFTATSSEIREDGGSATLTIRLTIPNGTTLVDEARVSWATQNDSAVAGTDYVAASGTAVFPAGTGTGAERTINVGLVDPNDYEEDETFKVLLSSPVNVAIGAGVHTVRIVDEDPKMYGFVDTPVGGSVLFSDFHVGGWGHDLRSPNGTNVTHVNVLLINPSNGAMTYLGPAAITSRPGVPPNSAFGLNVSYTQLPAPGLYYLAVGFRAETTGEWYTLSNQPSYPVVRVESPRYTLVDAPVTGSSFIGDFMAYGWAVDGRSGSGTGVDRVEVIANPLSGGAPINLGLAGYGGERPDAQAHLGGNARWRPSGYYKLLSGLPLGQYRFDFRARSTVDGSYHTTSVNAEVKANTDPRMNLEYPVHGSTIGRPFLVQGWAVDLGAPTGTGVATVHVWAYPAGGGSPVFLGADYGDNRLDVANHFGNARFTDSGFAFSTGNLSPGTWTIVAHAFSVVTQNFTFSQSATITIPQPNLLVSVESPVSGSTVGRPFHLAGWAGDLNSPSTNGVSRIDIYAFNWAGGDPILVAQVPVGNARPDVAASYGWQRHFSGWAVNAGANLPPGNYGLSFQAFGPDGAFLGTNPTYIWVTVQ